MPSSCPPPPRGVVHYRAAVAPADDRAPTFGDAELEEASAYLATWFEARGRTRECVVSAIDDAEEGGEGRERGERHFEIHHGNASADRSLVVYDEATRMLGVHALDFMHEGIRTSFGHAFWGDADHFERRRDSETPARLDAQHTEASSGSRER